MCVCVSMCWCVRLMCRLVLRMMIVDAAMGHSFGPHRDTYIDTHMHTRMYITCCMLHTWHTPVHAYTYAYICVHVHDDACSLLTGHSNEIPVQRDPNQKSADNHVIVCKQA